MEIKLSTNKELWDALKDPPEWALKKITGGRLSGKSDINPQWRYGALTEALGPCGVGWKYEISKLWLEKGSNEEVAAFAMVNLYIKAGDGWSPPIPGSGGSMFVAKEKGGLYTSDEAYKMAVTDALSVSMKMIGVAATVYCGMITDSKYQKTTPEFISDGQVGSILDMINDSGADQAAFLKYIGAEKIEAIPSNKFKTAIAALMAKKNANNR